MLSSTIVIPSPHPPSKGLNAQQETLSLSPYASTLYLMAITTLWILIYMDNIVQSCFVPTTVIYIRYDDGNPTTSLFSMEPSLHCSSIISVENNPHRLYFPIHFGTLHSCKTLASIIFLFVVLRVSFSSFMVSILN